jgi:hypothetical protein
MRIYIWCLHLDLFPAHVLASESRLRDHWNLVSYQALLTVHSVVDERVRPLRMIMWAMSDRAIPRSYQ